VVGQAAEIRIGRRDDGSGVVVAARAVALDQVADAAGRRGRAAVDGVAEEVGAAGGVGQDRVVEGDRGRDIAVGAVAVADAVDGAAVGAAGNFAARPGGDRVAGEGGIEDGQSAVVVEDPAAEAGAVPGSEAVAALGGVGRQGGVGNADAALVVED